MSDETPQQQNPNPEGFPPGPVKHFVKELLSGKPIQLIVPRATGKEVFRVPFEDIGDDMGAFSTDDVPVIMLLRQMARQKLMGVREVDGEELERTKKASGVNEKRRASLKQQSLLNGIRADIRPSENAADGKPSAFPDPVDTEKYVSSPDEMKLEIPEISERTPKARKARKAAEKSPAT